MTGQKTMGQREIVMAGRDYILCGDCGTKVVYDGDDNGRNRLETIWGDPGADDWTVDLLCPDCIAELRAVVERLHHALRPFARAFDAESPADAITMGDLRRAKETAND